MTRCDEWVTPKWGRSRWYKRVCPSEATLLVAGRPMCLPHALAAVQNTPRNRRVPDVEPIREPQWQSS